MREWLKSIGFEQYSGQFEQHRVSSLARLQQISSSGELASIGVRNAQHARKLLAAIANLANASSIGASGRGYLV